MKTLLLTTGFISGFAFAIYGVALAVRQGKMSITSKDSKQFKVYAGGGTINPGFKYDHRRGFYQ